MRFHKLEEFLRTQIGRSMLGFNKGGADFAQCVSNAQKFYVGDVAVLDGISKPQEFPRLPFSMCVFEFQDDDPKGIKRPFFVLAEELGASDPARNCIRVHSFCPYHMRGGKDDLWLHNGWVEVNRQTDTYDSFVNKHTVSFLAAGPDFECLADAHTLEHSMVASAQLLCAFLSVLNCSNVEVTEIAEPKILNRKRLKNRKVPIYSYKTLVLKSRQQRLVTNGYGTHESPRIHLRRGHIKRRKTGNFWWEPCVIGDRVRGIIIKDYHADKLLSA